MSRLFIVAAAVCGALGAAVMSPTLVAIAAFCIAGALLADMDTARRRHRSARPGYPADRRNREAGR